MTDASMTTGAVLTAPDGQKLALTAHFTYSQADPMAVSMTLVADIELANGAIVHDHTTWVFARDLLDTALSSMIPAGQGDVTVEYTINDLVKITLTHVDGSKHPVFVDAAPLVEFVATTLALVPANQENIDFDDEIAQLLDGAS